MKNLIVLSLSLCVVACTGANQPTTSNQFDANIKVQQSGAEIYFEEGRVVVEGGLVGENNHGNEGTPAPPFVALGAVTTPPKMVLGDLPVPNFELPPMIVCRPGTACIVEIKADLLIGTPVTIAQIYVAGQKHLSGIEVNLPAYTTSVYAEVNDIGGPSYTGHGVGPMQSMHPSFKSTTTGTLGTFSGAITHCQVGVPCNEPPDPIDQAKLCLTASLYFEDTSEGIYDKEVGETNEAVFSVVGAPPNIDTSDRGFSEPLFSSRGNCTFDWAGPHASNDFGLSAIKNLGKSPTHDFDHYLNLAERRWNPLLGRSEAAMDVQDPNNRTLSYGNNINQGGYGDPLPRNWGVRSIDSLFVSATGRTMILMSTMTPQMGYGAIIVSSEANTDVNGDSIPEFSKVENELQEGIGAIVDPINLPGGQLLSSTSKIQRINLKQKDASGLPYQIVLSSGDRDDTNGGYSAYEFQHIEIGLDAHVASEATSFPWTQHTRITSEFFREHDGSQLPPPYSFFSGVVVPDAVGVYLSKFAVVEDAEGHPKFFLGISEINDVYFDHNQVSPGTTSSGVAFSYKKNLGTYGRFIKIDANQTNLMGMKLADIGLGNFLNEAVNAVDIRYEPNWILGLIRDVGLNTPNVADGQVVITHNDRQPTVYEYWENAAVPFVKLTGGYVPDSRGGMGSALNAHLARNGSNADPTVWDIRQTLFVSTPASLTSQASDDNALVKLLDGQFASSSITHLQDLLLQQRTYTMHDFIVMRKHSTLSVTGAFYVPAILAGCANNDTDCDPQDKGKLRMFINSNF